MRNSFRPRCNRLFTKTTHPFWAPSQVFANQETASRLTLIQVDRTRLNSAGFIRAWVHAPTGYASSGPARRSLLLEALALELQGPAVFRNGADDVVGNAAGDACLDFQGYVHFAVP